MNGAGKDVGNGFGVGLVVSLMAALAACGADSDVLSSAELATEMNQLCVDNGLAFDEIGHPENFEEIAAMTPQLIEVFDRTLAKHAQLDVGPDESGAVTEFVALGEQQSDLLGRLQTAAATEDGAGFEEVVGEMDIVAERSAVIATNLGATECLG